MVQSGRVEFTPGNWGQFVTFTERIEADRDLPIVVMATASEPEDYFINNNVALTVVQVDGRIMIAATKLSEPRLSRLEVTWWAFQP